MCHITDSNRWYTGRYDDGMCARRHQIYFACMFPAVWPHGYTCFRDDDDVAVLSSSSLCHTTKNRLQNRRLAAQPTIAWCCQHTAVIMSSDGKQRKVTERKYFTHTSTMIPCSVNNTHTQNTNTFLYVTLLFWGMEL